MDKEEVTTTQVDSRWFIDADWFQQNKRSLSGLIQNYLCPRCRKRLGQNASVPIPKLMATIKNCCANTPEFVAPRLPILENIFRLFLANGNQPLGIAELSQQLRERLGDTYRTSPEIISRLLRRDQYYGLRPVTDQPVFPETATKSN